MAAAKKLAPIERFGVYLVGLDPTIGHEIKKTRPCVVVSPDDLNGALQTVIIAPFTSSTRKYRYRTNSDFKNITGQIALDQMRAVDKTRLIKSLGPLSTKTAKETLSILAEMFAE